MLYEVITVGKDSIPQKNCSWEGKRPERAETVAAGSLYLHFLRPLYHSMPIRNQSEGNLCQRQIRSARTGHPGTIAAQPFLIPSGPGPEFRRESPPGSEKSNRTIQEKFSASGGDARADSARLKL